VTSTLMALPSKEESAAESAARWGKALGVKDSQIILVSTQNEQLRGSLNRLEAELQELSKALLAKESALHGKDRELQKRDDEIRRLKALEQLDQGKERAIESASTQNGQLLALLEVHEGKTKLLTSERDRLVDELNDVKAMRTRQVAQSAGVEASVRGELLTLARAHAQLKEQHRELEARHAGFEDMVRVTERDAKATVQTVQEELTFRRERQFEALVKQQALEDRLRSAQDDDESRTAQTAALSQRCDALQGRLEDVMDALRERDRALEDLRLARAKDAAAHATELAARGASAAALQAQIDELGRSLLGVVGKHQEVSSLVATRSAQVAALKAELVEARSSEADREQEAVVAAAEAQRAEGAAKALRVEVTRLKREAKAARAALDARPAPPPAARSHNVQAGARRQAVLALVSFSRSLAGDDDPGPAPTVPSPADGNVAAGGEAGTRVAVPRSAFGGLCLARCALEETEFGEVLSACGACQHLEHLDLSGNFITDRCVPALLDLLAKLPRLRFLDLRSNQLSIEGIRNVALFLESSGLRGGCVNHVYVHRDGQIEAISGTHTVLTVDARLNFSDGRAAEPSPEAVDALTPGVAEKAERAAILSETAQRRRRPTKTSNQHSNRSMVLQTVRTCALIAPALRRTRCAALSVALIWRVRTKQQGLWAKARLNQPSFLSWCPAAAGLRPPVPTGVGDQEVMSHPPKETG